MSKVNHRRNQSYLIIASCILLVAAISFTLLFRERSNHPKDIEKYSLERTVNANFAGQADTSADAPALNRLVRGKVTAIDEEKQQLVVATYVSFPDLSITRDITLTLTPRTQFLCWDKKYRMENGGEIDVEQAGYLLDENTKLFQRGETRVDLNEAQQILARHKEYHPQTYTHIPQISALIALETAYSRTRENRVFQVAMLGCDEEK